MTNKDMVKFITTKLTEYKLNQAWLVENLADENVDRVKMSRLLNQPPKETSPILYRCVEILRKYEELFIHENKGFATSPSAIAYFLENFKHEQR